MQSLMRRAREIPGGEVVAEDMIADWLDEGGSVAEFYAKFHWGEEAETLVRASAPAVEPGEVLAVLGELSEIAYDGSKGGEWARWQHDFKATKPVLASTASGRLVIVGGSYKINRRGIVG
jgi:hypothetical protein